MTRQIARRPTGVVLNQVVLCSATILSIFDKNTKKRTPQHEGPSVLRSHANKRTGDSSTENLRPHHPFPGLRLHAQPMCAVEIHNLLISFNLWLGGGIHEWNLIAPCLAHQQRIESVHERLPKKPEAGYICLELSETPNPVPNWVLTVSDKDEFGCGFVRIIHTNFVNNPFLLNQKTRTSKRHKSLSSIARSEGTAEDQALLFKLPNIPAMLLTKCSTC